MVITFGMLLNLNANIKITRQVLQSLWYEIPYISAMGILFMYSRSAYEFYLNSNGFRTFTHPHKHRSRPNNNNNNNNNNDHDNKNNNSWVTRNVRIQYI